MRSSRNGLRPVTATQYNKELKGYLICFNPEGSLEEGIGLYAAIELEDGSVIQVDAYKVKFDDIEEVKKKLSVEEIYNS